MTMVMNMKMLMVNNVSVEIYSLLQDARNTLYVMLSFILQNHITLQWTNLVDAFFQFSDHV